MCNDLHILMLHRTEIIEYWLKKRLNTFNCDDLLVGDLDGLFGVWLETLGDKVDDFLGVTGRLILGLPTEFDPQRSLSPLGDFLEPNRFL
jgi:hypothetical protein